MHMPPKTLPRDLLRLPGWVVQLNLASRRSKCPFVRIAYGDHRRQYLLVCPPEQGVPPRKQVVVYIHGGGWQFGRPEMFRLHASLLTKLGFWVYLPSHRRIPRFHFRHIRDDLVAFMATIRKHMQPAGLHDYPLILGGSSSGGHLSALFTFHPTLYTEAGFEKNPVGALFLLGAPLHLGLMWDSPPLRCLLGSRHHEVFREANPIEHLERPVHLPVLIMHGEADGIVEPANASAFAAKLQQLNTGPTRLIWLPGGGHMAPSSWCYEHHPANRFFLEWLEEVSKTLRPEFPTSAH